MRQLSSVTLVAVTTVPHELEPQAKALEFSCRDLCFARVVLLAPVDPWPGAGIYEHCEIEPFETVGDWGRFIVFDLHQHVDTEHIILIHPDGSIVNPKAWDDAFLQYD